MSELYFRVKSDWQEVVRLRTEISRLENQLNQLNGKAPLDVLTRICDNLVTAKSRLSDLADKAALAGAKMDNSFSVMRVQTEAAARSTSKLSQAFGSFFQQFTAASLALQGFFKIKQAIGDAADTIADFQAKQSLLGAILGETNDGIKEMTEQAKDLGRTTVFTASQVSQLQIELSKLGFERKPIQEMTESILAFAQATGGDLGDAAALTGAAIRMFGAQTDEANRYTNAMARATTASALNFQAIRDNLATFGPMAHSIGLSIEDTLALFGTLKNAGIEGSTAMTSLRNIFTKVAQGKIQGMEGGVKTLDEFVQKLKQIADIDPGKSMKMIGPRGGTQFMTLLNQADQILELRDKIKEASSQDTTAGMATQMTNNVNGAIMMMKSAWEGFVLSFSESTGPWKDVIDLITQGITNLTNLISVGSTISKDALYAVMTGLGSLITLYGVKNGVLAVTNKLTAEQGMQYTRLVAALESANSAQAVGYRQELQEVVSKGIITKELAAKITALLAEADAQTARMQAERQAIATELQETAALVPYYESLMNVGTAEDRMTAAELRRKAVMQQGILTTRLATADANLETIANQKDAAAKLLNAGSTGKLTQAMNMLGLSMMSNPYIAVATAIAAVAYACYSAAENAMTAEKAQKLLNEAQKEHTQQMQQEESEARNLIKTIQDQNASLYDQYKAYKDLVQIRGVFAKYSQDDLKNMSQAEIDALLSEDRSHREQEMIKNRVKALQEYAEWLNKVGAQAAWVTAGEEDKLKEIGAKYGLGDETQKWFDSAGWNTNWKQWVKEMQAQADSSLQEYLENVAYSGLTAGLSKGLNNNEIGKQVSELFDSFVSQADNLTAGMGEKYKAQLQPTIDSLQERIAEINKELSTATGEKKVQLVTELTAANADLETLTSMMAFFEAGENSKELIIKIQHDKDNALLGDDLILKIADQYEQAEELGKKYEVAFEKAADKARETGATTEEQLSAIAEDLGITSENVEGDFTEMEKAIETDIVNLRKRYDEAKTDVERNKLKIEIEKKQELLEYISGLKTNILNLVSQRYTIFIDLAGEAWEQLKGLLGIGGKPSSFTVKPQVQPAGGSWASPQWGNTGFSVDGGFAWQRGKDARNANEGIQADAEEIRRQRAAKAEAEAKADEESKKQQSEKEKKAAEKVAKARAAANAKTKQEEWKHAEEMVAQAQKAERARIDAQIASIRSDAERERAERDEQHRRAIQDIQQQENEIYKKIYQQRKTAYETQHKGEQYANDSLGSLGWDEGVKKKAEEALKPIHDLMADLDSLDVGKIAEIQSQLSSIDLTGFSNDEQEQITTFIDELLSKASKANSEYMRKVTDERKQELASMREYLQQYGSLEQQKLALTQEYEQKIKDAKNEGEKLRLRREYETKKSNMSFENISMGIDWNALFSGVGTMTKEMMSAMMDKLKAFVKTDDYRNADSQTQQTISELIADLRGYLGSDKGTASWNELANAMLQFNQSVAEYEQARMEEQLAVEQRETAKQAMENGTGTNEAYEEAAKKAQQMGDATAAARKNMEGFGANLNRASDNVVNFTSKIDAALKSPAWANLQGASGLQGAFSALSQFKGNVGKELAEQMTQNLQKNDKYIEAKEALDGGEITQEEFDGIADTLKSSVMDGFGKATEAMSNVLGGLGDGLSSIMSSGVGQMVAFWLQIPQLILNLANSIKEFVTGILDSFTELLKFEWLSDLVVSITDAIGNLIDAIFDLPENLFKAIEAIVVNGIGGLLDGVIGRIGNILSFGALDSHVSDWFTNSNAAEVEKTTKELTEANERLIVSIDSLKEEIKGSGGSKSIKSAQEALEAQKKYTENQRDILKAQQGYHNAHHSNAYYWNLGQDHQNQVNNLLAEYAQRNNKTASRVGSDWGSFSQLSPEEMEYIRAHDAELWRTLTDIGKYDKSEFFNAFADLAGSEKEILDSLNEALTQTSFDTLKSNFISNLMDMSRSAEDFSDDFTQMMMQAVLNARISDLMDKEIQDFYDRWAELSKDASGNGYELTEAELAELSGMWDSIVENGMRIRDEVAAITGYDESQSAKQEADKKGFQAMSQDTGEELNGRFTALQIAGENISSQANLALPILTGMGVSASRTADMVEGIGRVADDMLTNIVECYTELNIIRTTMSDDMLPLMKKNKEYLEKIEKNTKTL